jgi:glycosyltransferase involved in cell wall biosynthesis
MTAAHEEDAAGIDRLRIGFLGETNSANTTAWIDALRRQPGVEVQLGPSFETFRRRLSVLKLARDVAMLRKWVKEARPDVLIGYRTTSYGFVAALTGVRPLVLAAQGESDVWPPGGLRTFVKGWTARFAVKRADLVHAWGPHMAESLFALGAAPGKVMVLSRGIDTELFRPDPRVRHGAVLAIACTRSLYSEYHVDDLVRGVASAIGRGVPARLVLVGDGPEFAPLEELSTRLGVRAGVEFRGRVPRAEVAAVLREASVYASTPETEGVSASLLEAMASGCIPVVTDLRGNREWVRDRENGFLVPVGDGEAVSRALCEIWNDRGEWESRGMDNVATIRERASSDRNIARFVAEYRRLLRERRAALAG